MSDTKHINNLSFAELERLSLLMEEMGESLQIIGKIQRHGYESSNPLKSDAQTNKQLLEKELGDVLFAIDLLCKTKDLNRKNIMDNMNQKANTIFQWLHYQDSEDAFC